MIAEVSGLTYTKLVLHALKYPHCAVRGVLLGQPVLNQTKDADDNKLINSQLVRVVDAIPAIHNNLLIPTIETLFIHLDLYCQEENLQIVGVYFANQNLNDKSFDEIWGRIANDKLTSPIVIQIENTKLSLNSTTSCLQAFSHDGKWKQICCDIDNKEDTISMTSIAVQNKFYRELSDFENHLDQPHSADFYNTDLNLKIETII